MTDNGTVEEQFGVFTRQGVKAVAAFNPVITFVPQQCVGTGATHDEVIAQTAKHLLRILADDNKVLAAAAEAEVVTVAGEDDVVSGIAVQEVRSANRRTGVGDDVVPVAAVHGIGFIAAVETVVAAVAPQAVDPFTAD